MCRCVAPVPTGPSAHGLVQEPICLLQSARLPALPARNKSPPDEEEHFPWRVCLAGGVPMGPGLGLPVPMVPSPGNVPQCALKTKLRAVPHRAAIFALCPSNC